MSLLHRQVLRVLIADIVSGTLREESRLPREADLARDFGVGRGVVREAIRGLEERGLVRVRRGSGAVVLPARSWDVLDADVLETVLDAPVGTTVLAEFVECRRTLEIAAAGLAAERATAEDLIAMAQALAQMTASSSHAPSRAAEDLFHEADVSFHSAILAAAGNRIFTRITEPIQRALATARRPLAHPEARLEKALPEHKRILTAISRRDVDEARAAMAAHLTTVERYLEQYAAATGRVAGPR